MELGIEDLARHAVDCGFGLHKEESTIIAKRRNNHLSAFFA